MADIFARMRQLIGTPAEWLANDLVVGRGELALELVGPMTYKAKIGDGLNHYSALPYFAGGGGGAGGDYVAKSGDTMTGPLTAPRVIVSEAIPPAENSTRAPSTAWVTDRLKAFTSGARFLGAWNAATNVPALTSGGGTPAPLRGDYYLVSVPGSTSIDGQATWLVGDQIAFNNTIWQRIPGANAAYVLKGGDTMTGPLTAPSVIATVYAQTPIDIAAAPSNPQRKFNATANPLDKKWWWETLDPTGALLLQSINDAQNAVIGQLTFNRDGTLAVVTPPAADSSALAATTSFVKTAGATATSSVAAKVAAKPMPVSGTFYTGATTGAIGAAGQKWRIFARVGLDQTVSNASRYYTTQIWNGAAAVDQAVMGVYLSYLVTFAQLEAIVTLTAPTTFSIRVRPDGGTEGSINADSIIGSVRLG